MIPLLAPEAIGLAASLGELAARKTGHQTVADWLNALSQISLLRQMGQILGVVPGVEITQDPWANIIGNITPFAQMGLGGPVKAAATIPQTAKYFKLANRAAQASNFIPLANAAVSEIKGVNGAMSPAAAPGNLPIVPVAPTLEKDYVPREVQERMQRQQILELLSEEMINADERMRMALESERHSRKTLEEAIRRYPEFVSNLAYSAIPGWMRNIHGRVRNPWDIYLERRIGI